MSSVSNGGATAAADGAVSAGASCRPRARPIWAALERRPSRTTCTVAGLRAATSALKSAGMVIAGGNWNLLQDNKVWDNWRAGFMLFSVPGPIREEEDPSKAWDTSHFNKYTGNTMSLNPRVLRASMELYKEIMFGESGLSRRERELLATVTSAEQSCHY